jgi:glutamine synthetase
MSAEEVHSRYHILMEKYAKDLLIEGNTLKNMVSQGVLPAAFTYRKDLADFLATQKALGLDYENSPEIGVYTKLTAVAKELQASSDKLNSLIAQLEKLEGEEAAELAGTELTVALEDTRTKVDLLESYISDKAWPYPKYTELLF